jgi:hypothetical protein
MALKALLCSSNDASDNSMAVLRAMVLENGGSSCNQDGCNDS